jgi:hypothetical protein
MGNPLQPNGGRILGYVLPVLLAAGIGWAISQSNDRFTGSEWVRQSAAIDDRLDKLEQRLIGYLDQHSKGGPHDDVRERLVRIEERLRQIESRKNMEDF